MPQSTYNTSIEMPPDDEEIKVTVHYTLVPFCAGSREGGRGLQLEPDEPAHLEDVYIYGPDGQEIEVSDATRERIEEEIWHDEYEKSQPDYD